MTYDGVKVYSFMTIVKGMKGIFERKDQIRGWEKIWQKAWAKA